MRRAHGQPRRDLGRDGGRDAPRPPPAPRRGRWSWSRTVSSWRRACSTAACYARAAWSRHEDAAPSWRAAFFITGGHTPRSWPGVATAVAVLAGAGLVGESVRESLRRLALERLGETHHAVSAPRWFRAGLADDVGGKASCLPDRCPSRDGGGTRSRAARRGRSRSTESTSGSGASTVSRVRDLTGRELCSWARRPGRGAVPSPGAHLLFSPRSAVRYPRQRRSSAGETPWRVAEGHREGHAARWTTWASSPCAAATGAVSVFVPALARSRSRSIWTDGRTACARRDGAGGGSRPTMPRHSRTWAPAPRPLDGGVVAESTERTLLDPELARATVEIAQTRRIGGDGGVLIYLANVIRAGDRIDAVFAWWRPWTGDSRCSGEKPVVATATPIVLNDWAARISRVSREIRSRWSTTSGTSRRDSSSTDGGVHAGGNRPDRGPRRGPRAGAGLPRDHGASRISTIGTRPFRWTSVASGRATRTTGSGTAPPRRRSCRWRSGQVLWRHRLGTLTSVRFPKPGGDARDGRDRFEKALRARPAGTIRLRRGARPRKRAPLPRRAPPTSASTSSTSASSWWWRRSSSPASSSGWGWSSACARSACSAPSASPALTCAASSWVKARSCCRPGQPARARGGDPLRAALVIGLRTLWAGAIGDERSGGPRAESCRSCRRWRGRSRSPC